MFPLRYKLEILSFRRRRLNREEAYEVSETTSKTKMHGDRKMKVCPKCGFEESPCWKRSFQGNPNGDIDVARIDSLKDYEPLIANLAENNRGLPMKNGIFVYYLAPRALWVKRILAKRFTEGGMSVFNIPHESGRPKREVES